MFFIYVWKISSLATFRLLHYDIFQYVA